MKQVLFKLKRRVVLFKETAQMILNQAEFSEVKPWLDLLSAEMGTDFAAEWKLQKLPRNSEQIWLIVRHFLKKEILRIGSALQVMCKENRPQDIRDEDVFIFAELCSELGHLAVYLQSPEVDEKLTDVAEGWTGLSGNNLATVLLYFDEESQQMLPAEQISTSEQIGRAHV